MQSSRRNISKKHIEAEIYNTFELFKKCKNIKIADFLKRFDVSLLQQKRYRKIKFSYESLIKLVLFQKLKGIKFQTQLRKYLKKHKKERYKLGLEKLPDRRTINYFTNHILDEETKELINYASDDTDLGLTEFYNDMSSEDVILAHSIVENIERIYVIPPGHWIDFFIDGSSSGSMPFESFDGLLLESTQTTQRWKVKEVKNVKQGKDPNKDWANFGSYVKVNDVLTSCTYYWIGDWTGWLKYSDGTSTRNLSYSKWCITSPHHIPFDPIFLNINGFSNFADFRYGVVEGGFNLSCVTEGYTDVTPDYQPGYQGSYGEAFIPQRYDGPYPPHKPITPDGPSSGSPGVTYPYSTYSIDPNGDEISYMFDWDDGTMSDWLGPFPSGQTIIGEHMWSEEGTYNVRVKAMDISGLESEWSDPLSVTMPKNKLLSFNNPLFSWLLDRFQNMFPILRQILGL